MAIHIICDRCGSIVPKNIPQKIRIHVEGFPTLYLSRYEQFGLISNPALCSVCWDELTSLLEVEVRL